MVDLMRVQRMGEYIIEDNEPKYGSNISGIDWQEVNSMGWQYQHSKLALINKMAEEVVEAEAWLTPEDFFRLMTEDDKYQKQLGGLTETFPTQSGRYIITRHTDGQKGILGTGVTDFPNRPWEYRSVYGYDSRPVAGRIEYDKEDHTRFMGRLCLLSSEYREINNDDRLDFINSNSVKHPVLVSITRSDDFMKNGVFDSGVTDLDFHFDPTSALNQIDWSDIPPVGQYMSNKPRNSYLQQHMEYAQAVLDIFNRKEDQPDFGYAAD